MRTSYYLHACGHCNSELIVYIHDELAVVKCLECGKKDEPIQMRWNNPLKKWQSFQANVKNVVRVRCPRCKKLSWARNKMEKHFCPKCKFYFDIWINTVNNKHW